MATVDFDKFRHFIMSSEAAQAELRSAPDHAEYMRRVVHIGNENGFGFTAEEYEAQRVAAFGKELTEEQLAMVAGGANRRCTWLDNSTGCSYGSCSFFSFY